MPTAPWIIEARKAKAKLQRFNEIIAANPTIARQVDKAQKRSSGADTSRKRKKHGRR